MINKDKFLKDNVSVEEFIEAFCMSGRSAVNGYQVYLLKDFFNEQVKQTTLTEDERVILSNIKNDDYGKYIGRGDSLVEIVPTRYNLYLRGNDESKAYAIGTLYNHLFRFIKERRRI